MAKNDDDVTMAASISVASCEHGSVFVRLHRRDGTIFAAGCMARGVASDLAADLLAETIGLGGAEPCGRVH